MLWIHPLLQIMATGLAFYVLSLGWRPFKARYLGGEKSAFPWTAHVKYGKLTHIFWMAGLVLGLYMVGAQWGQNGITQTHYWLGQLMMLCIAAGYITGWVMDNKKQERPYLPLIHAVFNAMAIVLALIQIGTGIVVMREFIF